MFDSYFYFESILTMIEQQLVKKSFFYVKQKDQNTIKRLKDRINDTLHYYEP